MHGASTIVQGTHNAPELFRGQIIQPVHLGEAVVFHSRTLTRVFAIDTNTNQGFAGG